MSGTIFSTYRQGENRVTSTIIQVLKNLPINLVERFLVMLTEDDRKSFFVFKNQVKVGATGTVPDAEISASFRILIETKNEVNAVRTEQLTGGENSGHLALGARADTTLV